VGQAIAFVTCQRRQLKLRAQVGSVQFHFHAAVLFAAIARLVVGGRAGLSVTDGIHAVERELAVEGQIPNPAAARRRLSSTLAADAPSSR